MLSNYAFHNIPTSKQLEVNKLLEIFKDKIDLEIIESVLINTNYNVAESSKILYELCGISAPKVNQTQTSKKPHKSYKELCVERAIYGYHKGFRLFVILRGPPGSGKSTLARKILFDCTKETNFENHIFSTDDYFIKNGVYTYDVRKLSEGHMWNQRRVIAALHKATNPIIVDNTNMCMWEMRSYATFAVENAYLLEVLEPCTSWCFNARELSYKNTHGVPRDKIRDMIDRYEKNISAYKLLCIYSLIKQYQPRTIAECEAATTAAAGQPSTSTNEEQSQQKEENGETNEKSVENKEDSGEVANLIDLSTVNTNKMNYPELKLESWGTNQEALASWGIVSPVSENVVSSNSGSDECTFRNSSVEMKDMDTNTSNDDFLLKKNLKCVATRNRDINENTPQSERKLMKKTMLDKSSMTEDECESLQSEDLKNLAEMFPNIPYKCLKDIYIKCDSNVSWAVELLTESDNLVIDGQATEDSSQASDAEEVVVAEEPAEPMVDKTYFFNAEELKTAFEEKIQINPACYSKNIIKIKKQRGGILDSDLISFDEVEDLKEVEKCSLKQCPISYNNEKPSTSKIDTYNTQLGTIVAMDSDADFSDISDSEEISVSSDEDKFFELNLGAGTISQLEAKFSDNSLNCPQGFQPVIQIPTNLARQLHALYVESCFQQLEAQNMVLQTIMKEDEELALKLYMEDLQTSKQNDTPNLKEIMDEQAAISIYQKEVKKASKYTADDLASLLTKQKLRSTFPTISEDVLMEVYHAYNMDYVETVQSLANSLNYGNLDATVMEPPISPNTLQDMKDVQSSTPKTVVDNENNLSPEEYRALAVSHLQMRQKLFEKAQNHFQQKQFPIASFYSNLAAEQTKLSEQANSMAAAALLVSNQTSSDTLDLHQLHVREALSALDIFLDANIQELTKSTNRSIYLHIITGRGKNSVNGIPKVRPAVISHLRKHKLKYSVINPGLLRIKLYKKKN